MAPAAHGTFERRYGGAAGRRLLAREMDAVRALLGRTLSEGGGCALEIGCGEGRSAAALAEAGRQPVGLDRHPSAIRRGHGDARPAVAGDARRLPFRRDAFDAVVALRAGGDADGLAALLAEAARVLRPGGVVVFSTARRRGTDDGVRVALHRAGLEPAGRIGLFAAPPALIRRLGPLSSLALAAERFVPERLRAEAYWAAIRRPSARAASS